MSLIVVTLLQFALTILGFQEMISKWNMLYHRRYLLHKNRTRDFMPRAAALGLQNTYVIILSFISSQNDE